MKHWCIFFILYILWVTNCYPQSPNFGKHLIYGEFLGAGDLYSINYEYLHRPNQSIRLGFSLFPENWYEGGLHEKKIINLPLSYQYMIGHSAHRFETSAGLVSSFTFSKNQPAQCTVYPDIAVGYRYHKPGKGIYAGVRIYLFMPWFVSIDKDEWFMYTGKSYYLSSGLCVGWLF